ncbi:16S rRNA (uracil(1498)-N(3))-methyltransferase [Campylobacter sp. IFREMER_LSEM_CL1846]|uniref:16S rRNA (uracil(1498)-N(3))-methyltransferase n=1 Tax=Campylobacter sp. IFREMER_LSEM_CL1846 TaxID=2911614 RepID=UPI0021E64261|nr:16S rRNA (uracil(1498)-N(3))-methyltransferase [Campylobacter sp. IFREMER_LSEM_CL1846]HEC1747449.1 16S rRNA (uracil(1498)-N(3))-methyltransferase [Campylobacter lari]MCV3433879.1 16S rRNA (uracil(1498)-N(3))-methyltransferase [Campylobacter sp. IFREMER_LSEM_CL1846]HEC1768125.1 16S rRNA (uracil(1498)-N(3))-methyltransferase [Campylobacter lari]HEC1788748.1 16S rRNA (uracil(1498)-N(3))-methyltransferase [Campylobacter lari]HEC1795434.1 16S rRNA (uracil(1498)-N(3))-methyltransferase [Campyloba
MQFLYHPQSGTASLELENEAFLHLKARRIKVSDKIILKNLKDFYTYTYECIELSRRSCVLNLLDKKEEKQELKTYIHLALAVIDPKVIEKTLPFLNELGVAKLSFVYMEYSQKNFKLDFKRMEKILIESSQQCGRASLMELESFDDFKKFQQAYENIVLIDFEGEDLMNFDPDRYVFLVGAEGGFSQKEREINIKRAKLQANYILKAQTALIGVASKFII